MDRLQSELGMAEERKVKYECQIKHLKSEKEDLLFDIKSYKEQVLRSLFGFLRHPIPSLRSRPVNIVFFV